MCAKQVFFGGLGRGKGGQKGEFEASKAAKKYDFGVLERILARMEGFLGPLSGIMS